MINKNLIKIALVTVVLLMIPLIAMQFTNEVTWTLSDFIFAGTLLFGSGCVYEFVSKRVKNSSYRFAVGIAVMTTLVLIWVNGAVGIIGSENNSANLMYFAVPLVGLIGAAIANLKPRGMSRTLLAMGVTQALVPVVALVIWKSQVTSWDPNVLGILSLNAIFVMLYAGSALLFGHAAQENN